MPVALDVTPAGKVTTRVHGDATVRIHFLNLVQVVRFTIPFNHEVSPELYTEHRNAIDAPLFAKLEALRLPPAEDCGDAEFVRRTFLDTIGVLPTAKEVTAFLQDPAGDKRAKLAAHLLARPEWLGFENGTALIAKAPPQQRPRLIRPSWVKRKTGRR